MAKGWDMWVIYDHPKDFPNAYVARRWHMDFADIENKSFQPTSDVLYGNLSKLRHILSERGLHCMVRHHNDDPVIIETWL